MIFNMTSVSKKSGSEGLTINGNMYRYPVANGESIKKGDFVEFMETGESATGVLVSPITSSSTYKAAAAAQLDDDLFILAYISGSSLYVRAAKYSDGSFTLGSSLSIGGSSSKVNITRLYRNQAGIYYVTSSYTYTFTIVTVDKDTLTCTKINMNTATVSGTFKAVYYGVGGFISLSDGYAIGFRSQDTTGYGTSSNSIYGIYVYPYTRDSNGNWSKGSSSSYTLSSTNSRYVYGACGARLTDTSAIIMCSIQTGTSAYSIYLFHVSTSGSAAPIVAKLGSFAGVSMSYQKLAVVALDESTICWAYINDTTLAIRKYSVSPTDYTVLASKSYTLSATADRLEMLALSSNLVLLTTSNSKAYTIVLTDKTINIAQDTTYLNGTAAASSSLIGVSGSSGMIFCAQGTSLSYTYFNVNDSVISFGDGSLGGTFVKRATSLLYNVGIANENSEAGDIIAVYRNYQRYVIAVSLTNVSYDTIPLNVREGETYTFSAPCRNATNFAIRQRKLSYLL